MTTRAPVVYTPAFCDQKAEGCQIQIGDIRDAVERADKRLWSLLILAIVNLLATIGGMFGILANHLLAAGVVP